ncbi:hypothetical protein [Pseudoxanthomonas koreensis]|uniref:hypothetical protein n=1 Tax=Pseudoxanthomonas koreensis TaxID=266061 RepID=UPI0035A6022F
MADESKTTQALLRALLREMEKSLAHPKAETEMEAFYPPPGYKTRVNVKEFERGQREGNWWDDSESGGGSEPFGLDLRPKPAPKTRAKRRPR